MFENVMPEKAMAVVRLSIALICCWPLPSTATKAQVLSYRILKVLCGISAIVVLLPVLNAAIHYYGEPTHFSLASIMTFASAHLVTQILIGSFQHDCWQRLIEHITASLKNAKSYERDVYQRYVNKYCRFYGLNITWNYVCATVNTVTSIFLQQPSTIFSELPFTLDYEPVRTIIFLHHSCIHYQCAASVSLNMFAGLLLMYTAARYEIVMIDLRESTSIDTLTMCVKKYHSRSDDYHEIVSVLFRLAKDVIDATQYIVCFTILYSSLDLVLCGLNIIGVTETLHDKTAVYVLGWDHTAAGFHLRFSTNAVRGVYESTWYDQVLGVQKTVLRILVPQAPIIISIPCFMSSLSLEYYCSYISNSVSLFAVMRLIVGENADFQASESTNSSMVH
ncbi:uncharacterized protein LOC143210809 [Lasioglossum baleicum]|uniref:uncharacterized protein LOC143210809 n=1 Tax=Lasioglossum baleicum TaxID=434251 RepID=UPI003FCCBED5